MQASDGKTGTYIRLVGDVSQSTGDGNHVHKGQPSMARSPTEVLVAVGVEFCVFR